MHGNVSEWCSDRLGSGNNKVYVCRGGNWIKDANSCRSSARYASYKPRDLLGFRVVFTANTDNNKKVLKITLPQKTTGLNIFQKLKSKIKSDTSMAITGVVRDQDGTPIDGDNFEILPPQDWELRRYPEGRFEAYQYDNNHKTSSGKYYFFARHLQQNLFTFTEFNEDANNLNFKLEPAAILTGKIVDSYGQGIQNAKINTAIMCPDGLKPFSLLPLWVQVNNEGKFQIRAVPLGHKYILRALAKGYQENKTEVNSENIPGNNIDIGSIVLARGQFSVSGIVVDRKGKPLANTSVHCYCEKEHVTIYTKTDSKGRFKADGIFKGPVIIGATYREESSGHTWYGQKHSYSGKTNARIVLKQKTNY
jgi:protocatechuate 3,4-dioxygenase beta subunit